MRNLLAVISCFLGIALAASNGRAQDVLWAERMGGADLDEGRGIAVDGSDNAYVTGDSWDSADFGPYDLTSAGMYDVFVAKIDGRGTVQWAKQMRGTSSDAGLGITADRNGNGYVTGYFDGRADFGSFSLRSAGERDIFVVKLGGSGTVQWAKSMGGASSDYGYGIAVDGSGNAYVTGY